MKSGRARASIRLTFAALRSFYQFLVIRKVLDSNILKAIDIPKPEKSLPKFLTTSQVGNFPGKADKMPKTKAGASLDGLP